jgi:transposase-like protein
MTKLEALQYFDGNVSALARALGMDQSTFYSWGEFPPGGRQLQLERITGNKLRSEPGCMERKPQAARKPKHKQEQI